MNHRYRVREIILKYHRGEPLTEAEQEKLDREMAHLPADKVWERIRSHVEGDHGAVVRYFYARWRAAAAVVVILIAVGLHRYQSHSARVLAMKPVWRTVAPEHYYAEVDGPDGVVVLDSAGGGQSVPYTVSLPDGSKVILSYLSSVRYAKTFVKRTVVLLGQAYFKVSPDEAKQFAVETGEETVSVLGTEFNWMHYPDVPDEVTLLSGKIRLSLGNFQRELQPTERAVIQEGSPIRVRVERMKRPEETLAWMDSQPSFEFDSTDLYTVIQRMAHYYQVGFSVDAGLRTGSRITGTLHLHWKLDQNIARMADILKGYAQIRMENGKIVVTKSTF